MSSTLPKKSIQNPPATRRGSLRFLGPGLILSAAIVGSGELIATTTLGAKTGFALMWIIVFGCLIKVTVQLEYGRFCIMHGERTYQAWNHMPGPRLFRVHWTLVISFFFMITIFFGQAGVLGGAAQVAQYILPAVGLYGWLAILVASLILILYRGKYKTVERFATLLNVMFITTLLYCVLAIQSTPYAFGVSDLADGFRFHLPSGALTYALAAFGITGVSAGEITMYPYWCLEKGYAAWTGPNDGSDAWAERARGWMRVMTLDALLSLVIYTVATIAFYILGAAVLSRQAALADGNQLILQLSQLFTEVLGDRARLVFMLGAFAVLYSTVFSNVASYSRLWTDWYSECGWINHDHARQRSTSLAAMVIFLPITWGVIYLLIQKPLFLVIVMGVSNTLFLVVVALQGLLFRYRYTDKNLVPSKGYDVALWLSILSILYLACSSLVSMFSG